MSFINLVLRSPRSGRLEGRPQARSCQRPSFETPCCARLLRKRPSFLHTLYGKISRRGARFKSSAEIAQQIREASCRRTGVGMNDQRHLGVAEFRKSVLRPQYAMIGEDGDVGQDADAETDRHGGLNAGEVGARIGDAPRTPGSLDGVNGALAIEAALLEQGER